MLWVSTLLVWQASTCSVISRITQTALLGFPPATFSCLHTLRSVGTKDRSSLMPPMCLGWVAVTLHQGATACHGWIHWPQGVSSLTAVLRSAFLPDAPPATQPTLSHTTLLLRAWFCFTVLWMVEPGIHSCFLEDPDIQ